MLSSVKQLGQILLPHLTNEKIQAGLVNERGGAGIQAS